MFNDEQTKLAKQEYFWIQLQGWLEVGKRLEVLIK